jgi:mRNA interferase MazF
MTNLSKYDIVVVKFPFASSLKYKARPAVIISSDIYNENSRGTFLIMAISSNVENKLGFELEVSKWKEVGLLKPSIFKASLATIEKDFVVSKLGRLMENDIVRLEKLVKVIC